MFKYIKVILIMLAIEIYFCKVFAESAEKTIPLSTCTFCGLSGEFPEFLCTLRDFLKVMPKYDTYNSDEERWKKLGGAGCYLLSGPSGTGKKAIAEAIAREAEVLIQIYNMPDLDDEKDKVKICNTLDQIYKDADQQVVLYGKPVILVFTSVDKDKDYQWLINSYVDDHWRKPYVITILTAHNFRVLAQAILSRSRIFEIEPPNTQTRKEIIKFFAQKYETNLSTRLINLMASSTDGLSGGDIENIFKKYSQETSFFNKWLLIHSLTRQRHITEKVASISTGFLVMPLIAYFLYRTGRLQRIIPYLNKLKEKWGVTDDQQKNNQINFKIDREEK